MKCKSQMRPRVCQYRQCGRRTYDSSVQPLCKLLLSNWPYMSESLMQSSLWDSSNVRLPATPLDAYHLYQRAKVHLAAVAGYIRHRIVASHNLSQFCWAGQKWDQFWCFPKWG